MTACSRVNGLPRWLELVSASSTVSRRALDLCWRTHRQQLSCGLSCRAPGCRRPGAPVASRRSRTRLLRGPSRRPSGCPGERGPGRRTCGSFRSSARSCGPRRVFYRSFPGGASKRAPTTPSGRPLEVTASVECRCRSRTAAPVWLTPMTPSLSHCCRLDKTAGFRRFAALFRIVFLLCCRFGPVPVFLPACDPGS